MFDFSSDVPAGGQVLAYAVGLTGWFLSYVTNSPYWAEDVAVLGVSLMPNLLGNQLYVSVNTVMTDYDGDIGAPGGQSAPGSYAQVTAIAIVGTSSDGQEVLGNLYGIANGQNTPAINVGTNTYNAAFLSGFMLTAGSPDSISSMNVGVSTPNLSQQQINMTATASTNGVSTTGTIDALVFSAPEASNFQLLPATITWGSPDGENGMTGSFSVTFDVPSGQRIVQAAVLQQSVDIEYGDAEIELVTATVVNTLNIDGSTVSGSYNLNIYDPDFGARSYILSSSTATISVIAQFGT